MNLSKGTREHVTALASGLSAAAIYAFVAVLFLKDSVLDHWLEILGVGGFFYFVAIRRSRNARARDVTD